MKYQPTSESIALQEAPLPVHGSKATRPRPEFREMFFDIWAARARTKLQNLGSERGMTSRPEASGLDAAGGKGSALGALTAMLRLTLGRLPRVLPTLVTRSRPIIRAAAISATGVSVAHIFKPSALCMPLTAAAAAAMRIRLKQSWLTSSPFRRATTRRSRTPPTSSTTASIRSSSGPHAQVSLTTTARSAERGLSHTLTAASGRPERPSSSVCGRAPGGRPGQLREGRKQGLRFTSETVLRQLYQHQFWRGGETAHHLFWPDGETDHHLFWTGVETGLICRKMRYKIKRKSGGNAQIGLKMAGAGWRGSPALRHDYPRHCSEPRSHKNDALRS
jgi:hypothetical protein